MMFQLGLGLQKHPYIIYNTRTTSFIFPCPKHTWELGSNPTFFHLKVWVMPFLCRRRFWAQKMALDVGKVTGWSHWQTHAWQDKSSQTSKLWHLSLDSQPPPKTKIWDPKMRWTPSKTHLGVTKKTHFNGCLFVRKKPNYMGVEGLTI